MKCEKINFVDFSSQLDDENGTSGKLAISLL